MSIFDLFPTTSDKNWEWAPIFFEPIVGSAERINIAIAVTDKNENYIVSRTFSDSKLHALFGKSAEKVNTIIDVAIESLESLLKTNKPIIDWVPPFDGFVIGNIRGANTDDISSVIKNAILLTSSIGSIKVFEDKKELEYLTTNKLYTDRWSTQIKNEIIKYNIDYDKAFGVKMDFSEKRTIKYDFLYNNYVSNFGLIVPGRFSVSIKDSKSKVFDLEYLMEMNSIFKPKKYDLIIGMPHKNDPTITSAVFNKIENTFSIISDYGKKHKINISLAYSAEDAAKKILVNVA